MEISKTRFFKDLTSTEVGIKQRRATILAMQIANYFEESIKSQKQEIEILLIEQSSNDDMGPDQTTTLLVGKDVVPKDYVDKIISDNHNLRKLRWKLEDSVKAYEDRFGKAFLKSRSCLTTDEISDFISGKVFADLKNEDKS